MRYLLIAAMILLAACSASVPSLIDIDELTTPPTPEKPVTVNDVRLRSGASGPLLVGVHNPTGERRYFRPIVGRCQGEGLVSIQSESLFTGVPGGESQGFAVILTAADLDGAPLPKGAYLCSLTVRETLDTGGYSQNSFDTALALPAQFTLTVV